jgi:hypothetical protein
MSRILGEVTQALQRIPKKTHWLHGISISKWI